MTAPVGRPTDYDSKFVAIAQKMCELGATDAELAEAFGVCAFTVRRWAVRYPDFCAALKAGNDAADERVQRSVYMQAVGYTQRTRYVKDGVVVEYDETIPPALGAGKLWLAVRKGWREKTSVEHVGPNDGPVRVIGSEMTPQQAAEAYQQMLKGNAG